METKKGGIAFRRPCPCPGPFRLRGKGENGGEAAGGTENYEENTVKGRYMESAKTIPEGITDLENMVRLSDGSLGIADRKAGVLYLSKDEGETWETKDVSPLIDVLNQESSEVTSIALAPDGGLFFSYVLWAGGVDENGNVAEVCVYGRTGPVKGSFP